MFEWFFPSTCPCSPPAKEWVEYRLRWLCNEFDDHVFNGRPLVLPTKEFFPQRYRGTTGCIRELLDRVCELMEVDPSLVDLEIVDDQARAPWTVNEAGKYLPNAAGGTYQMIDGRHRIE